MTYIEKIIDVTNGKESIRNYTEAEIQEVEAAKAAVLAEKTAMESELEEKEAARQAVLSKLGLTVEEAAALLA
jgi:hypothetical protein